jgi:hypothetical protein
MVGSGTLVTSKFPGLELGMALIEIASHRIQDALRTAFRHTTRTWVRKGRWEA